MIFYFIRKNIPELVSEGAFGDSFGNNILPFPCKKNNDILKFTLENDSFCNKKNLPFNSKKVERSSGVTHLRVKVSRWPIKPGPTQPRP